MKKRPEKQDIETVISQIMDYLTDKNTVSDLKMLVLGGIEWKNTSYCSTVMLVSTEGSRILFAADNYGFLNYNYPHNLKKKADKMDYVLNEIKLSIEEMVIPTRFGAKV